MSFGIAFALPAYNNPLSTGLNPFTQSGPTLDLLFTGLPAVDNTFVGSSLTLNFLTQQYQLPAQYSVWVADQGLTAKTFSQIVTFTRASTGTFVGSNGLVQSAAVDAPRFDYNPTTLAPLGFLVEESSQNRCTYSQDFTQATWVTTSSTKTTGISDPAGGVTAATITSTSANGIVQNAAATVVIGTTYTVSIWLRRRTGTGVVGIRAVEGANIPVTITSAWARYSLTVTATQTIGRVGVYCSTIGDEIDFWGGQLEAKAFQTSYIPTTTASATRAADLAAINTLSPWFNSSQGTLFAQFEASANTFTAYVDISNGVTAQNSIHIDNDGGLMRSVYYSGSTAVATLSLGAIGTVGAVNKVATSYALNSFRANRNGGSIVADTAGALPVGLTQMNIGADPSGTAANVINGHLQRITYYPRSMANYELQALTV